MNATAETTNAIAKLAAQLSPAGLITLDELLGCADFAALRVLVREKGIKYLFATE